MQHFVDREQELQTLQAEYDRPGSALVVLYGRRRVGKTTLISEFIREKPALFFLASEESEAQNRAVFKEKTAEFLNNDLLRSAEVKSWDILFRTILDKPFDRKPVIVLDEFQYLGKSNPAFPLHLPAHLGRNSKRQVCHGNLCGSLISMMESQTLSYSSPLYGRADGADSPEADPLCLLP
ncbi:MAG: ATP-binding protein [Evtepia sp.]